MQIADFKIGQKVWVENLEEDCLEKWTVKDVKEYYVFVENKEKEIIKFHKEDGMFVFIEKEEGRFLYVLYKNKKEAKREQGVNVKNEIFIGLGLLIFTFIFEIMYSKIPHMNYVRILILAVMDVRFFYTAFILDQNRENFDDKGFIFFSIMFFLGGFVTYELSESAAMFYMIIGGQGYVAMAILWLLLKLFRWIRSC